MSVFCDLLTMNNIEDAVAIFYNMKKTDPEFYKMIQEIFKPTRSKINRKVPKGSLCCARTMGELNTEQSGLGESRCSFKRKEGSDFCKKHSLLELTNPLPGYPKHGHEWQYRNYGEEPPNEWETWLGKETETIKFSVDSEIKVGDRMEIKTSYGGYIYITVERKTELIIVLRFHFPDPRQPSVYITKNIDEINNIKYTFAVPTGLKFGRVVETDGETKSEKVVFKGSGVQLGEPLYRFKRWIRPLESPVETTENPREDAATL